MHCAGALLHASNSRSVHAAQGQVMRSTRIAHWHAMMEGKYRGLPVTRQSCLPALSLEMLVQGMLQRSDLLAHLLNLSAFSANACQLQTSPKTTPGMLLSIVFKMRSVRCLQKAGVSQC